MGGNDRWQESFNFDTKDAARYSSQDSVLLTCPHMSTCAHMSTHMSANVNAHTHMSKRVHTSPQMCSHVHTCAHQCTHVPTCAHMSSTCLHMGTHVHTWHVHTCPHMSAHVYTCPHMAMRTCAHPRNAGAHFALQFQEARLFAADLA